MTITEDKIYNLLSKLSLRFDYDKQLSNKLRFRPDFRVYHPRKKRCIFIEVDGSSHIDREGYDAWRHQLILDSYNCLFYRIQVDDINNNWENVVARLVSFFITKGYLKPVKIV